MSSVFTELCEVYLCKYQMNHNSLPKNHVFLKTLGSYLGPETSALTGLILISPPPTPAATPTSFVPGERELSFSPVAQSCLLNRGPVCCHAAKLRFFLSWGSCLNSFCLGSHGLFLFLLRNTTSPSTTGLLCLMREYSEWPTSQGW